MNRLHPIRPTPEQIQEWYLEVYADELRGDASKLTELLAKATAWGADKELDLCCEWLDKTSDFTEFSCSDELRRSRRSNIPFEQGPIWRMMRAMTATESSWFDDNVAYGDMLRIIARNVGRFTSFIKEDTDITEDVAAWLLHEATLADLNY